MLFNIAFALLASASTAFAADAAPSLRTRALTAPDPECVTEAKCFLVNLTTEKSTPIDFHGANVYDPTTSPHGFSIKCNVSGGKVEYVKYINKPTKESTQYFSPERYSDSTQQSYWLDGDNSGDRVNAEAYLNACGPINIKAKFFTWKGGDPNPCIVKTFTVTAKSSGCVAPTKAPVMPPPTKAPVPPPTKAPVPAPTKAPVPPPTKAPVPPPTKAPVPPPTKAPVPPPTKAPVPPPTKAPVAPPKPPKVANCYLWPNTQLHYGHGAAVPVGTKIETRTSSGHILHYKTTSGAKTYAPDYKKYNKRGFDMRFVNSYGVAGDWTHCINYYGTSTKPPGDGKCKLWNSKLFLGTHAAKGSTVQVQTVTGKHFSYHAIGKDYVTAKDYKSYQSQAFYLRIVDAHGRAGHYKKCVNYTPIALDVDDSGAVEHISGEFIIDITGDGEAETLEEWFAPTEGILIAAEGISGGVVTGHHLFGDEGRTYIDGFEKLALLDANEDGEISGAELDGISIWIDANSNAMLDDGELSSLESHDIVSLSTVHDNFISEATLGDGSTMVMEDKWFVR